MGHKLFKLPIKAPIKKIKLPVKAGTGKKKMKGMMNGAEIYRPDKKIKIGHEKVTDKLQNMLGVGAVAAGGIGIGMAALIILILLIILFVFRKKIKGMLGL